MHLPWILLITGFATGFLATWIGLLLVNIKPDFFRLVLVASFYSLVNVIVRSFPIPFGVHFIILIAVLYILIMVSWRLNLIRTLIPTIAGMLVLMLSESLCISIIIRVSALKITDLMQEWTIMWAFLPQIIFVLVVVYFLDRYNLYLVDFVAVDSYNLNDYKSNSVIILTGLVLLLLVFQLMLNLNILYVYPSQFFKGILLEDSGVISIILMITIFATLILIIETFSY